VARYAIQVKPAFEKDFDALPKDVQRRVTAKIDTLASNPRPSGVEKLAGAEALYRVRIGDYRIVYEIRDAVLIVLLVRVRHRREVYR
jgi:mRNA interferase RelE/StbE